MTDTLGISEAQILGLFLASVFWGMLLITFVQAMRCMLWDLNVPGGRLKRASTINWPMLVVALLLMALSTFDVSLGLMHSIEAFIFYTGPGGSAARFTGLTDWVNILKVRRMKICDFYHAQVSSSFALLLRQTCNVVFGKVISDGVLVSAKILSKSPFCRVHFPLPTSTARYTDAGLCATVESLLLYFPYSCGWDILVQEYLSFIWKRAQETPKCCSLEDYQASLPALLLVGRCHWLTIS